MRTSHELRTGVLGGTFDPIHQGHLFLAREVKKRLALDRVLLMIARRPPHKGLSPVSDAFHRYGMAVLATMPETDIFVSRLELGREGPSYTVETMRALRKEGGGRYCFISGADSLKEIHLWRECDNLFSENCLVFVPRVGVDIELAALNLTPEIRHSIRPLSKGQIPDLTAGSSYLLDIRPPDISSTGIRTAIQQGLEIEESQLPSEVRCYIRKYGLYE